jgi:hypothetical protein
MRSGGEGAGGGLLSKYPFARIPEGAARRVSLGVGAAAVVGIASVLRVSGRALLGEGTRGAIVSLELAGSPERAARVMGAWESRGVIAVAIRNVWIDYIFLMVYATALALATGMASDVFERSPRAARIGVLLAWGALGAGVFDVIENVGLLHMLGAPGVVEAGWSWMTAGCAAMKFALVVGALLYSTGGALVWIGGRIARGGI